MCLWIATAVASSESPWHYRIGEAAGLALLPATDLYPGYIAAPRTPRFALKLMSMSRRDIDRTARSRLATWVGGSLGLFRIHPAGRPDRGFQLQLGAGVFAQWEEQGRDGIGWDGVYRVLGTWTAGERLAFRLGISHMSSHIVDEYIENTGRRRIGYTREEVVAGTRSWLNESWQAYLEAGWAHLMRSALQEHWRFQGGLEYPSAPTWWSGRVGGFAALDAQSHQESDWEASLALQVGLRIPMTELGRTYRVGLEAYRGRAPMGEFFRAEESHLALGWWLDF
jgi:hypothetical protein